MPINHALHVRIDPPIRHGSPALPREAKLAIPFLLGAAFRKMHGAAGGGRHGHQRLGALASHMLVALQRGVQSRGGGVGGEGEDDGEDGGVFDGLRRALVEVGEGRVDGVA